VQGEFAHLDRQGLLPCLELLGQIARMTAQGFGALGDEVVLPLLNLSQRERVLAGGLSRGGFALEDVDNESGFAFGRPALRALSIGIEFSVGLSMGLGFTHGRSLLFECGYGRQRDGGGAREHALLRLRYGLVSPGSTRPSLRLRRACSRGGYGADLGPVRRAYHLSSPGGGRSRFAQGGIQSHSQFVRVDWVSL